MRTDLGARGLSDPGAEGRGIIPPTIIGCGNICRTAAGYTR